MTARRGALTVAPRGVAEPRRRPQQLRSRARYDAMLGAAESLVVRDGLDSLTTTRVAEHAGVAVGTVYQYFPDVGAIVDCLAERCAEQFADRLGEALAAGPLTRKRDAANLALDTFVDFYRTNPVIQALRSSTDGGTEGGAEGGADSDANAATIGAAFDAALPGPAGRRILAVVADALVGRDLARLDDSAFVLDLEVQWAVAQALVPLAFSRTPDGDPAVLGHLRRLFELDVEI